VIIYVYIYCIFGHYIYIYIYIYIYNTKTAAWWARTCSVHICSTSGSSDTCRRAPVSPFLPPFTPLPRPLCLFPSLYPSIPIPSSVHSPLFICPSPSLHLQTLGLSNTCSCAPACMCECARAFALMCVQMCACMASLTSYACTNGLFNKLSLLRVRAWPL
jgi:hypothetical protein